MPNVPFALLPPTLQAGRLSESTLRAAVLRLLEKPSGIVFVSRELERARNELVSACFPGGSNPISRET